MRVYISRSSRHKIEEIQSDQLFRFFSHFSRDLVFENAQKPASIRTRTKHTRHQSRDLFRTYRSMCVSFLCVHFYLHPERVKDGQFSNACTYMCSIFYSKSSLVSTHFAQITREKVQHESRRKAGGNLHLRSAVVDLRVQLVGAFTFFFSLYT